MKVSVIIPTFKRSEFLIRAIESIINQTYSNIEIIVVDDNGIGLIQKETHQIVSKFPSVKLVTYKKNKGACFARNEGAHNATGQILMFLDDDDFYLPNKVKCQIEVFLSNPQIDVCLCGMKRIDQTGSDIISCENFPRGLNLKEYILNGNCFTTMIAIKKDVFDEVNGFDEIDRFQDKFFMYKLFKNNKKVELLSEQLFVFVDHNNERISNINYRKVEKAYTKLYDFEKQNKSIFSKQEFETLTKIHWLDMSRNRTSAIALERLKGIKYLLKSKTIFKNYKLFFRLLFTDKYCEFNKR